MKNNKSDIEKCLNEINKEALDNLNLSYEDMAKGLESTSKHINNSVNESNGTIKINEDSIRKISEEYYKNK